MERSAAADSRLQYSALEKVSDAMSSDVLVTVPRPVGIIEEQAILVIEWINGQSLTDLMRDWLVSSSKVVNDFEKAGIWLSAFHRSHRLPFRPTDMGWAFGMLENALAAAPAVI